MIHRFLNFELDAERRELSGRSGAIALQPQAFALLLFLVENADRVVTKDAVFEAVWPGRIVGDSTLNARLNAVRKALGDDGIRQDVIRTYPRHGFRFLPDVRAEVIEAAPQTADTSPWKSVAVLPFVPIGSDPEQAVFADGLTEDLITDLSKMPDLFVIARNTSFSYKASSQSISGIARDIGVAHILEGSVRRSGARLRINVQLVSIESGGPIWAERYDRDLNDVFAVQDEITREITGALQAKLTPTTRANEGATPETYELCMRARALFFQFDTDALAECIALLDKAVGLNPEYARAWAEQVFPYQNAHTFGFPGFEQGLEVAIEKGRAAVALDPGSGFALSRLGFALTMDGQHAAALSHFERAAELEPNNTDVLAWYCEALNFSGDPERAIDVAETCLHFDPIAPPNVLHHLAHAKYLLGDCNDAIEIEPRVLRVVPGFLPSRLLYAAALVKAVRLENAKDQIESLRAFFPRFTLKQFNMRFAYRDDRQRNRISTALSAAGLV